MNGTIACGRGDQFVKLDVQFHQAGAVLQRLSCRSEIGFDGGEVLVVAAYRCGGCCCRLQGVHRFPQFLKRHLVQHHGRGEALGNISRMGNRGNQLASTRFPFDEPVLFQHADGFANGRTIDAQLFRKPGFGRQDVPGRNFPGDNPLLDRSSHHAEAGLCRVAINRTCHGWTVLQG
ncbi:hypothetical protein D3C84_897280 [compost metagenome]